MSLLLLGASSDPNTRSLFANNEAGLAIDVGDRYGASESKRTWRRNLLLYSEQFDNSAWTKQGSLTATPNTDIGLDGLLSADTLTNTGVSNAAAYQSVAMEAGTYTFRVWVKAGTATQVQLAAWRSGVGLFATTTVSGLTSSYQEVTLTINNAASGTVLVYIYPNNSSATSGSIVVSRSMIVAGSDFGDYQPISDFNTEFKAAFPTHSLYVDSNGVAPAVYPGDQVGLILDTSRGGLDSLGSELNSAFDMSAAGWTTVGAGTTKTASTFTTTAAGGVSISHGQAANPLVNGRAYYVEISVSCTVSTTFDFRDGGSNVLIPAVSVGTTPVTLKGIANITNTLGMYLRGNAAGTYTIHSFSIKQIPGNHAYQTTSGSRPALARTPDGGRRNLLLYSEQFDNAAWTKTNSTISANATTAPDGTSTADTLIDDATNADHKSRQSIAITSGTTYTVSVYAKANTLNFVWIYAGTPNVGRVFNLATGATGGALGNAPTSSAISAIGNGWYRCSITYTAGATSTQTHDIGTSPDGTSINYIGTGQSAYLWGAQIETGSSATAYQKVGLTSDVTESGKRDCWGLLFDGSDDSLQTASVDFSATDKMTVMAGVRKNSDAANAMLVELSATASSNAGSFYITAPGASGANPYESLSRGSAALNANQQVTVSTGTAPDTAVLSTTHDIAGDLTTARRNGTAFANATGDKGSGNFGNYAVFIGSRSGSLRFNGLIYTLIVRGATTPTGTIADFERNLLARRCGVTF